MKHATTTGLSRGAHIARARKALGISKKEHKRLLAEDRQHWYAPPKLIQLCRLAFGVGPNPKVSVLLVPELRKRRSERDPVVLAAQIQNAQNRLAAIKAGGQ